MQQLACCSSPEGLQTNNKNGFYVGGAAAARWWMESSALLAHPRAGPTAGLQPDLPLHGRRTDAHAAWHAGQSLLFFFKVMDILK